MIVMKDNGTVYLAENAAAELNSGYESRADEQLCENSQVWHIPNGDGIIACALGSGFEADIFRYDGELITGELTMEKLVLETVPKIKEVLQSYGKLDEDGCMNVAYAFAQKDRAFVISYGFCVTEITNCTVYGRCDERGLAALSTSNDLPPEERILFACHMMYKFEKSPMSLIDTKTLTPKMIGEENK